MIWPTILCLWLHTESGIQTPGLIFSVCVRQLMKSLLCKFGLLVGCHEVVEHGRVSCYHQTVLTFGVSQ